MSPAHRVASHPCRPLVLSFGSLAILLGGCPAQVVGPPPGGQDATQTDGFPTAQDVDAGPANVAPGPLAVRIEPAEPLTEDELVAVVTEEAVDPDHGPAPLSYLARWTRDGEETPQSSLHVQPALTKRGETWTVEVWATDGEANGPKATATVTIGDTAPRVASVSLSPAAPTEDAVLVCEAVGVEDADDDAVSLDYQWFRDGELVDGASTAALQPPLLAGATYQCGARPFDGELYGERVGSNTVTVAPPVVQTEAVLSVQPSAVDLGVVLPGEVSVRQVSVHNIGTADLAIDAATVQGTEDFGLHGDLARTAPVGVPATVAPGDTWDVFVSFATDTPGLQKASLSLETNAKNPLAGTVPLLGVGATACLLADPATVDFGGAYPPANIKRKVVLRACGALPVTIASIAVSGATGFGLDLAPLPAALPLTLAPGEEVFVNATFTPTEPSPVGDDGAPIPEEGELSVLSDAASPALAVPLRGFAVASGCPVPVITSVEGATVAPGMTLHLSAAKSIGAYGVPSIVSWAVLSKPDGAPEQALVPAADAVDVSYDVSVPGDYLFGLTVFDEVGADGGPCGDAEHPCTSVVPGCQTAEFHVSAKEAPAITVELTWDTPGDPDQHDTGPGMGADLDLHLVDGGGEGPDYDGDGLPDSWFDEDHDCFWLGGEPDWGVQGDAADDPSLVLQDADGAGPERIVYPLPVPGGSFTVGVHCWSDFGFGPSVATIRVLLFDEPVFEVGDVVLESGDLWEALTITWPGGAISTPGSGGAEVVTASYPNPFLD